MEKKSLLQDIDNYLLDNTINNSLFNLFNDIKTYLTKNSILIEPPVKPACDGQILQAKIDELENWIKYLNWNPTNIIHKSMLMDRIKILENENRKSV